MNVILVYLIGVKFSLRRRVDLQISGNAHSLGHSQPIRSEAFIKITE